MWNKQNKNGTETAAVAAATAAAATTKNAHHHWNEKCQLKLVSVDVVAFFGTFAFFHSHL